MLRAGQLIGPIGTPCEQHAGTNSRGERESQHRR